MSRTLRCLIFTVGDYGNVEILRRFTILEMVFNNSIVDGIVYKCFGAINFANWL